MRDPRINPKRGDRLVKIVTNRRKVRMVVSRTILKIKGGYVFYTPRRQTRYMTINKWQQWARSCKLPVNDSN